MMMILFNSRVRPDEKHTAMPVAEKDPFWVTQDSPVITRENFREHLQTQQEMEACAAKILNEPRNNYTKARYQRLPNGKSGSIIFN